MLNDLILFLNEGRICLMEVEDDDQNKQISKIADQNFLDWFYK